MTNYEKYKNEILEEFIKSDLMCEFLHRHKIREPVCDYKECGICTAEFKVWLLKEAENE